MIGFRRSPFARLTAALLMLVGLSTVAVAQERASPAALMPVPLGWVMPKSVRPIPARGVASALLADMLDAKPGVRVLKSGAMQAAGQP